MGAQGSNVLPLELTIRAELSSIADGRAMESTMDLKTPATGGARQAWSRRFKGAVLKWRGDRAEASA